MRVILDQGPEKLPTKVMGVFSGIDVFKGATSGASKSSQAIKSVED